MRHHTKIGMPIDDLLTCTGMLSSSCIVQDVMPCSHRVLMNRSTLHVAYCTLNLHGTQISLIDEFHAYHFTLSFNPNREIGIDASNRENPN